MIHLEDRDVGELLDLRATTDALEAAFAELGRGEAATTTRVRASAGTAMASAMAAVVPAAGIGGGKLYGTHPGGFSFVVALFSIDGGVLCTLDGDMLTRIRTAAATALAVRHLAPPGARVAALFGTGNQSRWHAQALAQELELEELRIWGRSAGSVDELVAWAREKGLPARALRDPGDAVDSAGVVVAVTSSYSPVFPGDRLGEDVLVCGVGSTKAERREIDGATVTRAALIVTDSSEGAVVECGDLIQAAGEGLLDLAEVRELSEVVCGRIAPPAHGVVLFESQGIALEDVVAAGLAYRAWMVQ